MATLAKCKVSILPHTFAVDGSVAIEDAYSGVTGISWR
jgi:hypothetical protein